MAAKYRDTDFADVSTSAGSGGCVTPSEEAEVRVAQRREHWGYY